jgi:hypothetical protein
MKMTLILHLNINLDGIWNSRTQYNASVCTLSFYRKRAHTHGVHDFKIPY